MHTTNRGPGHGGSGRGRLAITSLAALGVVFGDIGTSPLYAFRESLAAGKLVPTEQAIIGLLSVMIWSLVIIVTIKYLLIVMRASNQGEGGILALTSLVTPISQRRTWLITVGLFGTALLYGDGVITPAISVLSAVEGLEVAAPGIARWVVPIAVAILIGLFSIQRYGTARVGAVFGPVMIVWFSTLAALGIWNLLRRPSTLVAINPIEAVRFFADSPSSSFFALGGIFLVVTGAEALYADMGHFGLSPIRMGWFTLVFPALVLNYLGQGALLIDDPTAIDNPFFRLVPEVLALPLVGLATLATVIASQALITGAFSLTMQAVQLGYLPRVNIDHTSSRQEGQVYVPAVNWLLLVACVLTVIGFQSSSRLAAAYGVAVTTTMVITTILIFYLAREVWGWSTIRAVLVFGSLLIVDLAFFASNIIKIPEGGWFPLVIAALVLSVILSWRHGKAKLMQALDTDDPLAIERLIGSLVENPQIRVPGTAVYMARQPGLVPASLLLNMRHNEVLHETVLLCTVQTGDAPRVHRARRLTVHELGEGISQVVLHFGFMEDPDVPGALAIATRADFGFDPTDAVFIVGHETLVGGSNLWDVIFKTLHRNATSAARYFGLPVDKVLEVGTQLDLGRIEADPSPRV